MKSNGVTDSSVHTRPLYSAPHIQSAASTRSIGIHEFLCDSIKQELKLIHIQECQQNVSLTKLSTVSLVMTSDRNMYCFLIHYKACIYVTDILYLAFSIGINFFHAHLHVTSLLYTFCFLHAVNQRLGNFFARFTHSLFKILGGN